MTSVASSPLIENAGGGKRFCVANSKGALLTRRDVLAGWRHDGFADVFSRTLAAAPYPAFFWETPPLDAGALQDPFECMLIPNMDLARRTAEPGSFSALVGSADGDVKSTRSLGGDAELVIPCDRGGDYAHLAAFLRTAPEAQIRHLWAKTAEVALRWLEAAPRRPIWISTAGLGVSWLHVRIESQPKYYAHAPYRQAVSKSREERY